MVAPGEGTLAKAMAVLDIITEYDRPVRFAEIVERSEYPRATLFRLFQSLTSQGLLQFDEDSGAYAPGLRLLRFAHAAWRRSALAPVARPFVDNIAAEVGETIHLAQMERGQVIYVDKRNADSPVEMFSQAGKIGPGYCTGVGKAIMAFLPDKDRDAAIAMQSFYQHTAKTLTSARALENELATIRSDRFAYDREEHEPGIICIAAPILNQRDTAIGALSITCTTQRKSLDDLAAFKPQLSATAAKIAEAANIWQFPEPMKG